MEAVTYGKLDLPLAGDERGKEDTEMQIRRNLWGDGEYEKNLKDVYFIKCSGL